MNIVYEVLRKLSYLKPHVLYNESILKYFLETSLKNYFNEDDQYEITINIKNNYLEVTNLTANKDYLIEKKENSIDFIKKDTNEILFHIRNIYDKVNLVDKKSVKNVRLDETNEVYSIINNSDGNVATLADLRVKISNKNYFEFKNNQQKAKIIGIPIDADNKYEQIFNYLDEKIKHEKKGVRKRILNLF